MPTTSWFWPMDGLSNSTAGIAWLPTKPPVLPSYFGPATRRCLDEDLADHSSARPLAPDRLWLPPPLLPARLRPADPRRRADAAIIRRPRRDRGEWPRTPRHRSEERR